MKINIFHSSNLFVFLVVHGRPAAVKHGKGCKTLLKKWIRGARVWQLCVKSLPSPRACKMLHTACLAMKMEMLVSCFTISTLSPQVGPTFVLCYRATPSQNHFARRSLALWSSWRHRSNLQVWNCHVIHADFHSFRLGSVIITFVRKEDAWVLCALPALLLLFYNSNQLRTQGHNLWKTISLSTGACK